MITQEEEDRIGQLRRCRDRLNQLSIGWIQLVGMQTSPLREAVLESLTEEGRQEFQEIEAIYRRGIVGADPRAGLMRSESRIKLKGDQGG